jgi:hypothetical protein
LIIVKSESALEIFCNFFAELNLDESAGRLRAESGLNDKLWFEDSMDSMLKLFAEILSLLLNVYFIRYQK